MKSCDLMINSKLCLPVNDEMSLLEDQSIAIDKGLIIELGDSKAVKSEFYARENLDLPDHLVMPGLIDCHIDFSASSPSALLSHNNTFLSFNQANQVRSLITTEQKPINNARALAELLKRGTTTFAGIASNSNIELLAEQCSKRGVRSQLSSFITEELGAEDQQNQSLRQTLELHDKYKNSSLINIAFGLTNPCLMKPDFIEVIAMYANEVNAPIQGFHATRAESSNPRNSSTNSSLKQHQLSGLLGPNFQSIPLTKFDEEELAILKSSGTKIVHCPSLIMANAQGCNSLQELWEEGFDVGVGTHCTSSNNFGNQLDTAFLAALLSKHQSPKPITIETEDLIYSLTLGGAKVLGLASKIGSIESGKKADLIALNIGGATKNLAKTSLADLLFGNSQLQLEHSFVSGISLPRRDYEANEIKE